MRQAKPEDYPYNHILKNKIDASVSKSFSQEWLNEEEKNTAADLFIQFQKNSNEINSFLALEYAVLQNKSNVCLYKRCYQDIFKDKTEIRPCVQQCTEGVKKAEQFVQNQFESLHNQFNKCIEAAHKDKFVIQNVFKCYDQMNQSFDGVKLNVREEFNYYQ